MRSNKEKIEKEYIMETLKISNDVFCGNIDCFKNLIDIYNFCGNSKNNILDLSEIKEVNPFNMLVIALALKECKNKFGNIECYIPNNENTDKYMQYMGFYETCDAPVRDVAKGNRRQGRYICITKISLESQGSIESDYDMIEQEAKKLAEMIQFDKELGEYVKDCFFEMIRNVYEHADTNDVYVCAQYWPNHNLIEIAIADKGCGIQKAMSKRYKDLPEDVLMKYAMTPGLSALSNHAYLEKDDYYKNSGYGLYMTKELALAYEGSFIICSGNYARRYYCYQYSLVEKEHKTKFNGTAIAIRFSTDKTPNFRSVLEKIKNKAESKSKSIKGAIKKASKSSGGDYGKVKNAE